MPSVRVGVSAAAVAAFFVVLLLGCAQGGAVDKKPERSESVPVPSAVARSNPPTATENGDKPARMPSGTDGVIFVLGVLGGVAVACGLIYKVIQFLQKALVEGLTNSEIATLVAFVGMFAGISLWLGQLFVR
jgi:hypothetical protein